MQSIAARHAEYPLSGKGNSEARNIYLSLFNDAPCQLALARSRLYLVRQLEAAKKLEVDMPQQLEAFSSWIDGNTFHVGGLSPNQRNL